MSEASPPPDRGSKVGDLVPLVRSVVGARVSDPAVSEDLVQEALARLVAVERRLDPSALAPYAVVTARNVVRGMDRAQEREVRHRPRMLDPRQPDDPAAQALEAEDRQALAVALERLPGPERESLVAHHVEGVATAALAERSGTTPGAVAARLARARARLRVEYLLVLRRVELPTGSCKPVLLAVSAGDKRKQRALGTGQHLLACPECAELGEPLVRRGRPLAALWPFLALDHLARWLRRSAREHPAPTAAAGVAVAALTVWAVVALAGGEPRPNLFVVAGSSIPLSGDEPMAPYAGMTVEARGVPVQSVVHPRGFWVGGSRAERVWVDVHDESAPAPELAPGQRITFEGKLVGNTAETLEQAGRGGADDRAQLERQGHHIDVAGERIQPTRRRDGQ